jgi:hypothetical protein
MQTSQSFFRKVLRGDSTREEAKDTGLALVLVCLLFWVFRRADGYGIAAIVAHLFTMTAPQVFRPIAVIWFGVSKLIGAVASRVILTVIFFGVVTPIGLFRRLIGADTLKLRAFKAGRESVMKERNHRFIDTDLEHPY